MIRHVSHPEIDFNKWDKLVKSSKNSDIFCFSWYLSNFCEWNALVLDDYAGVIALPYRRKYGFKTVYQPVFIQKCVWFGTEANLKDIQDLLLQNYDKILFNTNLPLFTNKIRDNYIVPLACNEEKLISSFKGSLRRGLKHENQLHVKQGTIDSVYKQYINQYGYLSDAITPAQLSVLKKLAVQQDSLLEPLEVYLEDELVASLLYLFDHHHKRVHYLIGAPTSSGRKHNAMAKAHLHVMRMHLSSDWVFDFEGSSIPSVAQFYKKFGSLNEPFYEVEKTNNVVYKLLEIIYNKLKRS